MLSFAETTPSVIVFNSNLKGECEQHKRNLSQPKLLLLGGRLHCPNHNVSLILRPQSLAHSDSRNGHLHPGPTGCQYSRTGMQYHQYHHHQCRVLIPNQLQWKLFVAGWLILAQSYLYFNRFCSRT